MGKGCQFIDTGVPSIAVGDFYYCKHHLPWDVNDLSLRLGKTLTENSEATESLKSNWTDKEREKHTAEIAELLNRDQPLDGVVVSSRLTLNKNYHSFQICASLLIGGLDVSGNQKNLDLSGTRCMGDCKITGETLNLTLAESVFESNVTISGHVSTLECHRGVFFGLLRARGVQFGKTLNFSSCAFHSDVSFVGADFSSTSIVSFYVCTFEGDFSFRAAANPTMNRTSFRMCNFEGYVGFEGRTFKSTLDFEDSTFAHAPHFQDSTISFESTFPKVTGFRDIFQVPLDIKNQSPRRIRSYYEGVIQPYRVLRYAMKLQDAHDEEAMFWELEMRAKERALSWNYNEIAAKLFSRLYALTSRYGNSIARPLIWWAAIWIGTALMTYLSPYLVAGSAPSEGLLLKTIDLSLQQTIRPFSIWGEEGGRSLNLLFRNDFFTSETLKFGIRIVATVQSVVSLTLLALFGFALRRKFRMA